MEEVPVHVKRSKSAYCGHVTRFMNEIKEALLARESETNIRGLLDTLNEQFEKYENAHSTYMSHATQVEDEDTLQEQNDNFELRKLAKFDIENQCTKYFDSLHSSKRSHHGSASIISSKSNDSRKSQLHAKLKLEHLEKIHQLRLREAEIQHEKDMLEARVVLEQANIELSLNDNPIDTPVPSLKEVSMKNSENMINDAFRTMSATIAEGFSLPKLEITKFNGNSIDYIGFIHDFECNIASKTDDENRRLSFLIQNCVGEARKAIECCRLIKNGGYTEAKKILKSRFGQPYLISNAFITGLVDGPPIKDNDVKSLLEFSTQFKSCQITLAELGYKSDLNASYNLKKIVERLPSRLQNHWIGEAGKLRDNGIEPTSLHLQEFIEKRARYANDPVFGLSRVKEPSKQPIMRTTPVKPRSFATQAQLSQPSSFKVCADCSLDHYVQDCKKFKDRTIKERHEIIKRKKLCFNCLIPNHNAKNCKRHNQCGQCGKRHHILVHDQALTDKATLEPKEGVPTTANKANIGHQTLMTNHSSTQHIKTVYFQVVPVKITNSMTNASVDTYAILDSASDINLCDQNLLDMLGIQGDSGEIDITSIGCDRKYRTKKLSLEIQPVLDEDVKLSLSEVWSLPKLNINPDKIPHSANEWPHLSDIDIPTVDDNKIMLLIGACEPEVFVGLDHRIGKKGEPIAVKGILGWSLIGGSRGQSQVGLNVNLIQRDPLLEQVKQFWDLDSFGTAYNFEKETSFQDRKALQMMKDTVTKVQVKNESHYQVCLPSKEDLKRLPNNRVMAEARANSLKRSLKQNPQKCEDYKKVINDYIEKGYARKVPPELVDKEPIWYIPHHAVMHPRKKKLRVVFDCAAQYKGYSLNDTLLSGPDLTNSITAVLLRFRQEPICIIADIESMFHQVRVPENDAGALRFLWWQDNDLERPLEEYQMLVHLFGAASSPSVVNYAVRCTADDNRDMFPPDVIETVYKNFYVDDLLKSVRTREEAISLITDMRSLLKSGGFNLKKWSSNDIEVISRIPAEERAESLKTINLGKEKLPNEWILGLEWNPEEDAFKFTYDIEKYPCTRRGILSAVCSTYDPLGLLSPLVLKAKLLLQDLCKRGQNWDDSLEEHQETTWNTWKNDLLRLKELSFPRYYANDEFKDSRVQLHTFSDASEVGYGCVSYLRFENCKGEIFCRLIFGKSRVAPLKSMSIPKMELQAALLASRTSQMLTQELEYKLEGVVLWTDSMIVLQYLRNESKRFKVFVANRIAEIQDRTSIDQWKHVDSKNNPADCASRGLFVHQLSEMWIPGPSFLCMSEDQWPVQKLIPQICGEDTELKGTCLVTIKKEEDPLFKLCSHYSSWYRLKRAVGYLSKFKQYLISKVHGNVDGNVFSKLSVRDLQVAENDIARYVQRTSSEIAVKSDGNFSKTLTSLNPILGDGLLKVAGRCRSEGNMPSILPYIHPVTNLIIREAHVLHGHVGRNQTLASVRTKYWILRGKMAVRKVLNDCVTCRKWNSRPMIQRMAGLPKARVAIAPPFTYTGVDYFGPILVKYGRGTAKRYGCLFTCLTTRAVHLEASWTLDTSSFIQAFCRFTSRRNRPKEVYSDNGTNFVGAESEMRKNLQEWNQQAINQHMTQSDIVWHFNPPEAPHMGGIWERLVRSTKKIIHVTVGEQLLSDESLVTLFAHVEFIMNSRPLTSVSDDPSDLEPLTPNHLLLQAHQVQLPIGLFDKCDSISRKHWRQVQYMADVFWKRWRSEYMDTLQRRSKWTTVMRDIRVGDLVLISEKTPRSHWPLGRVTETFASMDGLTRSCSVRTKLGTYTRPIHKLVLLESFGDSH